MPVCPAQCALYSKILFQALPTRSSLNVAGSVTVATVLVTLQLSVLGNEEASFYHCLIDTCFSFEQGNLKQLGWITFQDILHVAYLICSAGLNGNVMWVLICASSLRYNTRQMCHDPDLPRQYAEVPTAYRKP